MSCTKSKHTIAQPVCCYFQIKPLLLDIEYLGNISTMKFPNLASGQEKPFLWGYTMHSNQSIPLNATQYSWNCSPQPQGAHSFCSLIVRGHPHQPAAWQSTAHQKEGYEEEAILHRVNTLINYPEKRQLLPDLTLEPISANRTAGGASDRQLTRLAALLTQTCLPRQIGLVDLVRLPPRTPRAIWCRCSLRDQQEWLI